MKLKKAILFLSKPSKISMVLIVFLCLVAMVQGIILMVDEVLFSEYWQRAMPVKQEDGKLSEEEEKLKKIREASKQFLPDGTVHNIHYVSSGEKVPSVKKDQQQKIEIYDVNANLLWEGVNEEKPYEYLSWSRRLRSYIEQFDEKGMRGIQLITPESSRAIEIPVWKDGKVTALWRYVPEKGYFVGYGADGQRIGYLGGAGMSETKSGVKSFGKFNSFSAWRTESGNAALLCKTEHRIYKVDIEKNEVEVLFESAESKIEELHFKNWSLVGDKSVTAGGIRYRPMIQFMTADGRGHFILREPEETILFRPPERKKEGSIEAAATEQGIFVFRRVDYPSMPREYKYSIESMNEWMREYRNEPFKFHVELYLLEDGGNLELLNEVKWWPKRKYCEIIEDPRRKAVQYASNASPVLYWGLWRFFGRPLLRMRSGEDIFISILATLIYELRGANLFINAGLSVLMVCVAFWHGWSRRVSWLGFGFWLVFVFLFNLPGLLTYLGLNHTPVIRCSVCGGKRGLEKLECPACKEELAVPKRRDVDLLLVKQMR